MSRTPDTAGRRAAGGLAEGSGPASRRVSTVRAAAAAHGNDVQQFWGKGGGAHACVETPLHTQPQPQPALRIRAAERQDVPKLGEIWQQMMAEHVALHPAFALADDAVARWRASLAEMLESHDSFVFLAAQQGVPVGFCSGRVAHNPAVYATQRVGLICELAVAREARRRGVGAALVHRARAFFATRALEEFQLSAALQNVTGRAFWRAMGGEELLVRFRFRLTEGCTSPQANRAEG